MPTTTSKITPEWMAAEKTRLTERVSNARAALAEFEAFERVMARSGGKMTGAKTPAALPAAVPARRRGRPAKATATASKAAKAKAGEFKLGEACCAIVAKHPNGCSPAQITAALKSEYGQTYRPNHIGIALQREKRGGRLQERSGNWYTPDAARIAA